MVLLYVSTEIEKPYKKIENFPDFDDDSPDSLTRVGEPFLRLPFLFSLFHESLQEHHSFGSQKVFLARMSGRIQIKGAYETCIYGWRKIDFQEIVSRMRSIISFTDNLLSPTMRIRVAMFGLSVWNLS